MRKKRVSAITAVCGAFSHSKLVSPMDILEPTLVSQKDCTMASQNQIWNTEDGRQLRMSMNTKLTYKYIESGSIIFSETNVACEGGEVKIKGKKHENVIKLVTVLVSVTEIDVFEKKSRLKTTMDGTLPRACNIGFKGCSLDDMTLVLDMAKINLCSYQQIRSAKFEYVSRDNTETTTSVINDEFQMHFTLGEKVMIPPECQNQGHMISTNFPLIFLVTGDIGNGIDLIDATEVYTELETRVTDLYLAHWAENVVKESEVRWQSGLCGIASNRLADEQVVLHDGQLLKTRGEMI
jgi:hypothetical protein